MAWFPPRHELFVSLSPRDPLHPQPWSVKSYSDRHGGTEYVVLDANGSYVAEASEKPIAEAIAAGKPADALLKPEEPIHKRVRRLEAELVKANEEMRRHNEDTFRKSDERLKRCGHLSDGKGGPEHTFILREYDVETPSTGRTKRTGKYRCGCGAKMEIEN